MYAVDRITYRVDLVPRTLAEGKSARYNLTTVADLVLVADADASLRASVASLLQRAGLTTRDAESREEALAA